MISVQPASSAHEGVIQPHDQDQCLLSGKFQLGVPWECHLLPYTGNPPALITQTRSSAVSHCPPSAPGAKKHSCPKEIPEQDSINFSSSLRAFLSLQHILSMHLHTDLQKHLGDRRSHQGTHCAALRLLKMAPSIWMMK